MTDRTNVRDSESELTSEEEREVSQAGNGLDLGNGINIGNSLDVYLKDGDKKLRVSEYEKYWGNPAVERELFSMIAQKGFRSVRIPISWGDHLLDEDVIDPAWLRRVDEVVHDAMAEDLYVIIDLHHEGWLIPKERQEDRVTERFIRIWTQIAEKFADVDEKLIFESMNEPRLVDTKEEWTSGTSEARGVVNRLNQVFIDTVRSAGSCNETRYLMIPAYCSSGTSQALEAMDMSLFSDDRVIAAVHAYYPYNFTLDQEGTAYFDKEDKHSTKDIDRLADDLDRIFRSKGIQVVITEFAADDKDQNGERLEWLDYYLDTMNGLEVPCFWWDNGKTSRLMNRDRNEWREEEIVERLIEW